MRYYSPVVSFTFLYFQFKFPCDYHHKDRTSGLNREFQMRRDLLKHLFCECLAFKSVDDMGSLLGHKRGVLSYKKTSKTDFEYQ